jgi:hypothetical protein
MMDFIEFAEKIYGSKLSIWQKELLKSIEKLPRDAKIVFVNGRYILVKNGDMVIRKGLEVK